MGGIGNKGGRPPKNQDKPKKPPNVPVEGDDEEDGDFATPKRDRSGSDDEPLG